MDMQDVYTLIGAYGFPIVVTGFLLTKGAKILSDLTTVINSNTLAIQKMLDRESGHNGSA